MGVGEACMCAPCELQQGEMPCCTQHPDQVLRPEGQRGARLGVPGLPPAPASACLTVSWLLLLQGALPPSPPASLASARASLLPCCL